MRTTIVQNDFVMLTAATSENDCGQLLTDPDGRDEVVVQWYVDRERGAAPYTNISDLTRLAATDWHRAVKQAHDTIQQQHTEQGVELFDLPVFPSHIDHLEHATAKSDGQPQRAASTYGFGDDVPGMPNQAANRESEDQFDVFEFGDQERRGSLVEI